MMCDSGDTVEVQVHHVGEIRLGVVDVDRCMAPVIKALNEGGIATEGCCCGHGKTTGHISLSDGRILGIYPNRKVYLHNCPVSLKDKDTELSETHVIDGEQALAPVPGRGELSEGTRVRVITSLTWLVTDARHRFDDCKNNLENGSSGGYSPELAEAIKLLDELKIGALVVDKDVQIEERLNAGVLSLTEAKEKHKEEIKEFYEIIKGGRVHDKSTLEAAYRQGFEDAKKVIMQTVQELGKRI